MHAHYIDGWQGELAAATRADEAWLAGFAAALEPVRNLAPEAFEAFLGSVVDAGNPASEWSQTKAAIVSHAQAWQTFHEGCGLTVGAR